MTSNDGGGTSRDSDTASIMAAAASAIGSADSRFPSHLERRRIWRNGGGGGGCWSGFSCFGTDKRTKRIVPSSRIPDGTMTATSANGARPAGHPNQTPVSAPSLLAPPSSPASSLANSAFPSTAQSPKSCFLLLSTDSPVDPSSTMFEIGPYAHETQLVSPPVFSAFTTEPSTAPFTPPPESAHITTPSSPDVPYARYLSSSMDFRSVGRRSGTVVGNDLQATYPLCPGSPSSSLISPASGTPRTGISSPFPESEPPSRDVPYSINGNGSSRLFGHDASTSKSFMLALDSSLFSPASSAQFQLDQAQRFSFSRGSGGRLSISREGDNCPKYGYMHSKSCKQDVEELEAYRASFGFSADEIITTPSYNEACDEVDISFTVETSTNKTKTSSHQYPASKMKREEEEANHLKSLDSKNSLPIGSRLRGVDLEEVEHSDSQTGVKHLLYSGDAFRLNGYHHASADDVIFPKTLNSKGSKSFHSSSSDEKLDYRRSRSLKDHSMMTF